MFAAVNSHETDSAAATGPSSEASPVVLPLKEVGKGEKDWTLTLHPGHLALAETSSAQPYVIPRQTVMDAAVLSEGMRLLMVKSPVKATFKLAPESVPALAGWIGKPVLARFYLRQRSTWLLPIAILWVLGSLPLAGNAEAGIRAIPLDKVGLGLGLALVGFWAIAKYRPHPILFLLDSAWFVVFSGYLILDVLNGRSKFWLLFVVVAIWLVINGIKHFVRFRVGWRVEPAGSPPGRG